MSFQNQQESLSAVMDDEADELELRRVLASSENAEFRATWARYQVARAAMHKELLLPNLDLTAGINAALDGKQPEGQAQAPRGTWHTLGRIAIAASVTLAVLAGVRFYHETQSANEHMANAQPAPANAMHEPPVLVGFEGQEGQTEAKPLAVEPTETAKESASDQ